MKKILILILLIFITTTQQTQAQEGVEKIKAEIQRIEKVENCTKTNEYCIKFTLKITEEGYENKIVTSEVGYFQKDAPQYQSLSTGNQVFLQKFNIAGEEGYSIVGVVRDNSLLILVTLFIVITIAIGGWQGFGSLVGLGLSVLVMFGLTIPLILQGHDPLIVGIGSAFLILIISIYFSHGLNAKTTVALLSTLVGLLFVSAIAIIFLALTKLTGYGSEEAFMLVSSHTEEINMFGLLFASIIIGGIGVLDDVTVSQVSVIQQLYKSNYRLSTSELFQKAMIVGRDHIASMVNTLFIAYASASLPLVMLLQSQNSDFGEIINAEQFTEEIVRTFVGSIGLILVVPITTAIAAYLIRRQVKFKWLDLREGKVESADGVY